ncbi:Calycin-like protein [Aspergillus desertorum]
MWFFNKDRIVYTIHGGPMAGRKNFQTATYQCIRPGDLLACLRYPNKRISTLLGFSKGHWIHNNEARGDKRNAQDLARWRELAKVGASQADRVLLSEQADIVEDFRGPGDLEPIEMEWPTL